MKWSVCNNLQLYSLEERFIHDFVGQLGGTYGPSPFWRYARLPVTVHNLGGCRMADSEAEGVTSALGEVFHHAGLFVMDGAVLPSATGVNPSHTIAAVAERNIERIVRRVTGQPDWSPPERRDVRPFVDALSQVSVPPEGTAPPVKPALGLGLRERLSGSWTGHRSDAACDLEIRIPDIAEFVADPAHVGAVTGTLVVGDLTKGAADITACGTCSSPMATAGRGRSGTRSPSRAATAGPTRSTAPRCSPRAPGSSSGMRTQRSSSRSTRGPTRGGP
ncbi:GMC family oxidoreductase [Sorangium sp. So ce233]|uniref:GMC family oxidoreductase n=1 Tax=Sorangium sp. So ce233 TaxID=3133290 RepID=UPI003F6307FA